MKILKLFNVTVLPLLSMNSNCGILPIFGNCCEGWESLTKKVIIRNIAIPI